MGRRRLRTWAKWACTLAAGVCVAAAVFSSFYVCHNYGAAQSPTSLRSVGLGEGLVWYFQLDQTQSHTPEPEARWTIRQANGWLWGLSAEMASLDPRRRWCAGIHYERDVRCFDLSFSVLYPVLLTTIPAALLWHADRRRFGAHTCAKCGYDRRGLAVDAKCPECGAVPVPASK